MASPGIGIDLSLSKDQIRWLFHNDRETFNALQRQAKAVQIKMARSDINAFVSYVMRTEKVEAGEKTGRKLKQAPTHIEMQSMIDQHQKTVIWGAVGVGKCTSCNTVFSLEDGRQVTTLQLKALVDSGLPVRVWTVDTETLQPRTVPVKSVTYNGKVQVKRVVAASGNSSIVSRNHPFYTLKHGEFRWKEAADIRSATNIDDRDKLVIQHDLPPYARTLSLDPQEAFDIGFVLTLLSFSGGLRLTEDSMKLDAAKVHLWEHHPSAGRSAQVLLELGRIAHRRGLHLEGTASDAQSTFEVYGLSKWLRQYGKSIHRTTKNERTTAMVSGGPLLIDNVHLYDEPSCAGMLAGAMAVLVSDRDGKKVGQVRHRPDLVYLGRLAGVRTRGWRKEVFFESHRAIYIAATVGFYAPSLKGYFDGVSEQLAYDFRTTDDAEVASERHIGKGREFMSQWRPRPETGVGLSRVTYTSSPYSRRPTDTWGVEIDDEQHSHLTDGILTHNTQQISIARTLFTLGNNLNTRVLIVQSTADLAKDILSMIKKMIEESEELHEVFPDLVPGDLWQAREVRVKRTNRVLTPSIRAIGAETQIDGSRYDLIIVDDSLSFKNTRSKTERDNHYAWLTSVPFSREEDWTTTIVIGNAWHVGDSMHLLAKMEGWKAKKFPARDQVTGKTLLPERWPQDRIDRWIKSRPPAEVRRTLDVEPFSNETSRFDSDWFHKSFKRGIDRLRDADGNPVHFLTHYNLNTERAKVEVLRKKAIEAGQDPMKIPMPVQVSSGADLGFGLSEDADFTVIFTAVFFDNGECLIINIDKGRYGSTEIIPRIISTHKLYGATIFLESMFTQQWVYNTIKEKHPDLPVYPWRTDGKGTIGNKWDMLFGIESVAFDIGTDRWILPCLSIPEPTEELCYEVHPFLLEFKDDCLMYTPDSAVHTSDLLIAAWIMLQGARIRGSQEYLIALSDIGSMYSQYREDGYEYIEGEPDEQRWGREITQDLKSFLADAGLENLWGKG